MAFGSTSAGIKLISKAWEESIRDTLSKLKKRKDTNAKATAYVGTWIQGNFQSQGEKAVSGGWKPLSPLTISLRIKGKKNASPRILEDRGNLKNRWKRFYTDVDAYIESGVDYAAKHDKGDPHNKWNGRPAPIPARKILPVKDQVWPGIKKIYKIFLGKVLR